LLVCIEHVWFLCSEPGKHLSQFRLMWPVPHYNHLSRVDMAVRQQSIEIPWTMGRDQVCGAHGSVLRNKFLFAR
jgi:hypothetical protein